MECHCRTSSYVLPHRPSLLLHDSQFPSKLRLSKLKGSILVNRLVIKNACGFGENGSVNWSPITPKKIFMDEAIGAEYGEGFESFRRNGLLKVDVDFLNDRLQEDLLQRIRHAMKPDEAYGLIFSWDNVVVDTRSLKLNAWKQLAYEEGKEIPGDGDMQRLILYAGAEHVLRKVGDY